MEKKEKKINFVLMIYFLILLLGLFQLRPMNILGNIEPKLMSYEEIQEIANTLVLGGIFFVPILSGLAASSLILAIYEFLKDKRGQDLLKFFIPKEKIHKINDLGSFITSLLSTVEVQAFMIFLVGFTLFRIFISLSMAHGETVIGILYLFAIPISFALPLILAAISIYFLKSKIDINIFLFCFVYGLFIAMIVLFLNEQLLSGVSDFFGMFKSLIFSPVMEEFLKGLLIIVLATRKDFVSIKDFALAAILIGLGFAAFENFLYFVAKVSPYIYGMSYWTSLIIYRSVFNLLAHGLFTFSLGFFIYLYKQGHFELHSALPLGLFFAFLTHSMFNFSAIVDVVSIKEFKFPFIIFNPFIVVVMFIGFTYFVIHFNNEELQNSKQTPTKKNTRTKKLTNKKTRI
ncbi:MAG: PrsW family intramembrane metalloprotease [Candidatus Micrarchaeota archaeon]|nr:PrsW family intramembrane metalloprotease [Candidatus Micrarchaeota archaeon]